jgi:hypothetical protein
MKYRIKLLIAFILSAIFFLPFLLSLVQVWMGLHHPQFLLSGLFPRSDAFFHLSNAFQLLSTGHFVPFNRILMPILLASLLSITGYSIWKIQLILTVLIGSCSVLLIIRLSRQFGIVALIIFWLCILELFRQQAVGLFMSECIGLLLGVLSFAVLLQGMEHNRKPIYLLGIALFTLGMCARPGALLVLPLLCFFAAILISNEKKYYISVLFAFISVCFVMFAHALLVKYLSNGNVSSFDNFAYTLYGIATGGQGFLHFKLEYPNASSSELYSIIGDKIVNAPYLLLKGLWHSFELFVFEGSFAWFIRNKIISTLFHCSFVCGVFLLLLHKRERFAHLLLLVSIGTICSSMFLPDGGSRIYAVTSQ